MGNNFRNIALGLTALVLFGACTTETKDEVGRYVPINAGGDFIDTKTGIVYHPKANYDITRGYYRIDAVKMAKIRKHE
jgi:hypothetical protein